MRRAGTCTAQPVAAGAGNCAGEAAKIGVPVRVSSSPNTQHGDLISPEPQTYPPFASQSDSARAVADTDNWTGPYGPGLRACTAQHRLFHRWILCSLRHDKWAGKRPWPAEQRDREVRVHGCLAHEIFGGVQFRIWGSLPQVAGASQFVFEGMRMTSGLRTRGPTCQ